MTHIAAPLAHSHGRLDALAASDWVNAQARDKDVLPFLQTSVGETTAGTFSILGLVIGCGLPVPVSQPSERPVSDLATVHRRNVQPLSDVLDRPALRVRQEQHEPVTSILPDQPGLESGVDADPIRGLVRARPFADGTPAVHGELPARSGLAVKADQRPDRGIRRTRGVALSRRHAIGGNRHHSVSLWACALSDRLDPVCSRAKLAGRRHHGCFVNPVSERCYGPVRGGTEDR